MAFDLGQLKNLKLREVWAHEEREFTPWLALDENMARLSAAIGLELQLEHVEVPVGPYCTEIGAKLQWIPNPEKRDKVIALSRQVDLSDRSRWPEYCDWLVDTVLKFRKAFMPRVRLLRLDGIETAGPPQDGEQTNP